MSDFILEILDPSKNILELETSFIDNINNLEIEIFNSYNLEIVNTEKILWSDLPDNIPISKISGNLDVSRIDGLQNYIIDLLGETATVHVDDLIWGIDNIGLSGYLNQYQFDCGTP